MNAFETQVCPDETIGEFHGGNLDWADRKFGRPPQGWMDLSTGINPWPYPFSPINSACWQNLPTSAEIDDLKAVAARCYGAPARSGIVPASGSQALIQLLPRLRSPSKVAVLSPTYGEHRAAWRAGGHTVEEVVDETEIDPKASVVVVTNPNNPDGRIFSKATLRELRKRLARQGGWLIVDEAFADVVDEVSLAGCCGDEGLVVIRSFGKFYGLAGLRLGFAMTSPALARTISDSLGPWAVSGPAISIASEALADEDWQRTTRNRIAQASGRLDDLLARAGLEVIGGTPLFRLAAGERSAALFQRLGKAGILARHFPENPSWLRFGIPGSDEGFARLEAALLAA